MKSSHILLVVLIALITGFGGAKLANKTADTTARTSPQETAYDRIMRTGTIRCGYTNYAPYFIIDPQSGAKSGILFDVTQLLARKIGLKVEWTQETTFATYSADLNSGRIDSFCLGVWENGKRGRESLFSNAISYAPVYAYISTGDAFQQVKTLQDIKVRKLRISTVDGEMGDIIAKRDYPDNPIVSMPANTDISLNAENILTNKADLTFLEGEVGSAYLAKHPNALRQLTLVQTFPNTYAFGKTEWQLRDLFNVAIREGLATGEIQTLTRKYLMNVEDLLMPNSPYQAQ